MPQPAISGRCLCGAVSFTADVAPLVSVKCYCTDCRKTSGAAYGAHTAFPRSAVAVSGKLATHAAPADSGNMVTRAFCPTCGTQIYATNEMHGDLIMLRAATFDDISTFAPQMSIYASRAPAWNKVDADMPAFPEMPPAPPAGRAAS